MGNLPLQKALQKISDSYETIYEGRELEFFQTMNRIVPDPNYFSDVFQKNVDMLCPELTQISMEKDL